MNNKLLNTVCTTVAIGIIGLAGKLVMDAFKDIKEMDKKKEEVEEPSVAYSNIMTYANELPDIAKQAKVILEESYDNVISADTPSEFEVRAKYYERLIGDINAATNKNEFAISVESHTKYLEEKKKKEEAKMAELRERNRDLYNLNAQIKKERLKAEPIMAAIGYLGKAAMK